MKDFLKDFLNDFLKDFLNESVKNYVGFVKDFLKELVKDSWRIPVRNCKPIISKGIIGFLWKTNYSFRKPICFIGFPLNYCIKTNKTNKTNVFIPCGILPIPNRLKTLVLLVLLVCMQEFKGKLIKHIGFQKEYLVFHRKLMIPLEIIGLPFLTRIFHESFTNSLRKSFTMKDS